MNRLSLGYTYEGIAAGVVATRDGGIQAAQANADQQTKAAQAQITQFDRQQQAMLESEGNATARVVGLLGAVGRIVGNVRQG